MTLPKFTSSPRSWGCFFMDAPRSYLEVVFPTLVGVFLVCNIGQSAKNSLPHARGGVSYTGLAGGAMTAVFPTLVGVFLSYRIT